MATAYIEYYDDNTGKVIAHMEPYGDKVIKTFGAGSFTVTLYRDDPLDVWVTIV